MKKLSTHAATAKAIRLELKKAFPLIKFSVKSDSFAGGNSVSVSWINGPSRSQIHKIVDKYQYGHFDGMRDLYEMTNSREDIPQVKYVQVSREITEEVKQEIFLKLRETHVGWENLTSMDEWSEELYKRCNIHVARDYIWRLLSNQDLTNGFKL